MIILPPEPAPPELTARVPIRTLQEHFLAFLNANNPRGFDADVVVQMSASTIGGLMLLVALNDSVTEDNFKLEAKKLKKMSLGAMRHCHCLELMSRLFGYASWHDARVNLHGGRLRNRRTDRDRISMKVFDIANRTP